MFCHFVNLAQIRRLEAGTRRQLVYVFGRVSRAGEGPVLGICGFLRKDAILLKQGDRVVGKARMFYPKAKGNLRPRCGGIFARFGGAQGVHSFLKCRGAFSGFILL